MPAIDALLDRVQFISRKSAANAHFVQQQKQQIERFRKENERKRTQLKELKQSITKNRDEIKAKSIKLKHLQDVEPNVNHEGLDFDASKYSDLCTELAQLIANEHRMKLETQRLRTKSIEIESKLSVQSKAVHSLQTSQNILDEVQKSFERRSRRMAAEKKKEMAMMRKLNKRFIEITREKVNRIKSPVTDRLQVECAENRERDESQLEAIWTNDRKIEELVMDKMKRFRLKLQFEAVNEMDIEAVNKNPSSQQDAGTKEVGQSGQDQNTVECQGAENEQ